MHPEHGADREVPSNDYTAAPPKQPETATGVLNDAQIQVLDSAATPFVALVYLRRPGNELACYVWDLSRDIIILAYV